MIKWSGESWGISAGKIRTIKSFQASAAVTLETTDEVEITSVTGQELETVSFSYSVSLAAGIDPRAEIDRLTDKIGASDFIKINGANFSNCAFHLKSVQATAVTLDAAGRMIKADLTLSFIENPEISTAGIEIYYNGVDIAQQVSVSGLYYDSYAESRADELQLIFNDPSEKWDGWKPENGVEISVKCGKLDTGVMFIRSVIPQNDEFVLKAFSIPQTANNKKSKSWQKVYLQTLAQEIATRAGLSFETHGLPDKWIIDYVIQKADQSDFNFLEQRAKLEGCAFLVYDKKLVLYLEKAIEATAPAKTIKLSKTADFKYTNDAAARSKSMTILNGAFIGNYTAGSVTDTAQGEKIKVDFAITDQAEANRIARALLREKNKNSATGVFTKGQQLDLAAGSVIKLKTEAAKSWNGPAFIYHIRHDLLKRKSKIWIRKPLDY